LLLSPKVFDVFKLIAAKVVFALIYATLLQATIF